MQGGLPHSFERGPGCPFSCPLPQVGCFDPYSDDPRLGVQKIALCKYTAKMVVAGTAGQVRWQGQSQAPLGSCIEGLQTLQAPMIVLEWLLPWV